MPYCEAVHYPFRCSFSSSAQINLANITPVQSSFYCTECTAIFFGTTFIALRQLMLNKVDSFLSDPRFKTPLRVVLVCSTLLLPSLNNTFWKYMSSTLWLDDNFHNDNIGISVTLSWCPNNWNVLHALLTIFNNKRTTYFCSKVALIGWQIAWSCWASRSPLNAF